MARRDTLQPTGRVCAGAHVRGPESMSGAVLVAAKLLCRRPDWRKSCRQMHSAKRQRHNWDSQQEKQQQRKGWGCGGRERSTPWEGGSAWVGRGQPVQGLGIALQHGARRSPWQAPLQPPGSLAHDQGQLRLAHQVLADVSLGGHLGHSGCFGCGWVDVVVGWGAGSALPSDRQGDKRRCMPASRLLHKCNGGRKKLARCGLCHAGKTRRADAARSPLRRARTLQMPNFLLNLVTSHRIICGTGGGGAMRRTVGAGRRQRRQRSNGCKGHMSPLPGRLHMQASGGLTASVFAILSARPVHPVHTCGDHQA